MKWHQHVGPPYVFAQLIVWSGHVIFYAPFLRQWKVIRCNAQFQFQFSNVWLPLSWKNLYTQILVNIFWDSRVLALTPAWTTASVPPLFSNRDLIERGLVGQSVSPITWLVSIICCLAIIQGSAVNNQQVWDLDLSNITREGDNLMREFDFEWLLVTDVLQASKPVMRRETSRKRVCIVL